MSAKRSTVHPRVCGEQPSPPSLPTRYAGSSPRVRGTGWNSRWRAGVRRFIPACAGNRSQCQTGISPLSVHPRVCGEQVGIERVIVIANGSSPRVRGTGRIGNDSCGERRFIPACAGNRPARSTTRSSSTVHPRVCGEQAITATPDPCTNGSSPRVRGTENGVRHPGHRARFIPACAGNSCDSRRRSAYRTVHPRVCGEQASTDTRICCISGSSPRVRGTVGRWWWVRAISPVHPRVCREQNKARDQHSINDGSSPRVRGTVPNVSDWHCVSRFIPACAGNRLSVRY